VQPGGQFDIQQLFAQAMSAQQELAATEVTGQAGGGLVTVTLTGDGNVRALTIDPKVVDPDDVDTLQDLVVGALADAHRELQEMQNEVQAKMLGPLAGGLGGGGLGLPGV